MNRFVFFLTCLGWGCCLQATPPDLNDVALMPLCADGDRITLLARSKSNRGSHFRDSTSFALHRFDSKTGDIVTRNLGSIELNADPESGDQLPPEFRRVENGNFVDLLRDLATGDCFWLDQEQNSDVRLQSFSYRSTRTGLEVGFEGQLRTIKEGLRTFFSYEDEVSASSGPLTDEFGSDDQLEIVSQIDLTSRTIMIVRVGENDDDDPAAHELIAVPSKDLFEAQAWLVNAFAYTKLHQIGRFEAASQWFELATQLDPTNETARYNLACAFARWGKSFKALVELRQISPRADLKERILADPDFKHLVKDAQWVTFLESLPSNSTH